MRRGLVIGLISLMLIPYSASAALTEPQIQAILSVLNSFGVDSQTLINVTSALRGQPIPNLPTQSIAPANTQSPMPAYSFTRDLTIGSTGEDVRMLQKLLNASVDTRIALTGTGSPGNESTYFGTLTQSAVIKFQKRHGILPSAGYVGSITRAKLNQSIGPHVLPTTTPTEERQQQYNPPRPLPLQQPLQSSHRAEAEAVEEVVEEAVEGPQIQLHLAFQT